MQLAETGRKASKILKSITDTELKNYRRYLRSITPRSTAEEYWRWVLAFLSIRSRWKDNVAAYLALHALVTEAVFHSHSHLLRHVHPAAIFQRPVRNGV